MHTRLWSRRGMWAVALVALASSGSATTPGGSVGLSAQDAPSGVPGGPHVSNYVIGPGDLLTVTFWREPELSGDVLVRPDGLISVPLLNEIFVAGLTPEQLRLELIDRAQQYVTEPTVTVAVAEINSRLVYITGLVTRAGSYPLVGPTTVLQLIATAGGLREFADESNIVIMRTAGDPPVTFTHTFNFAEVVEGRRLEQNIVLEPGDTVIVR